MRKNIKKNQLAYWKMDKMRKKYAKHPSSLLMRFHWRGVFMDFPICVNTRHPPRLPDLPIPQPLSLFPSFPPPLLIRSDGAAEGARGKGRFDLFLFRCNKSAFIHINQRFFFEVRRVYHIGTAPGKLLNTVYKNSGAP